METIELSKIQKETRSILEYTQDPSLLEEMQAGETTAIERLIRATVIESVKVCMMQADINMLGATSVMTYPKKAQQNDPFINKTLVECPEEMLRLAMIEADSWDNVVTEQELLPMTSPVYRMVLSRHIHSVGVKARPMAFYSWLNSLNSEMPNGTSKQMLRIYPAFDKSLRIYYYPLPKIWEQEGTSAESETTTEVIDCPHMIFHAVCYYTAYQIAMVQGWQNAGSYKSEAMNSLGITTAPVEQVAQ